MRKLLLLALLALLPRDAVAATCVAMGFGNILVVDVQAVGSFFSLAGEFVDVNDGFSTPVAGTAHLRGDGKAHFGLTVFLISPPYSQGIIWMSGTLDPPTFASGTAVYRGVLGGDTGTIVLAPASCPPIPQNPARQ